MNPKNRSNQLTSATVLLAAVFFMVNSATTLAQSPAEEPRYDLVVYGGTSGGVIAAVQAAKMGRKVVLVSPTKKLGGLTASGLGMTDTGGWPQIIGGLASEYYSRIHRHYEDPKNWKWVTREDYLARVRAVNGSRMMRFEPHIAEAAFEQMIADYQVPVVRGERLDLKHGVVKEGTRITALRMESGRLFAGRMFIDASYEGDVLPLAGVTSTWGRESRTAYGERFAGVQKRAGVEHQFRLPVDPYVKPGDASSGLLPEIHHASSHAVGEDGSADRLIQAYNFRLCLTDVKENQIPFTRPNGYDPARYELLGRYFSAGFRLPFGLHDAMPNRKSDLNNFGPFSVDYLRGNDGYVDGGYATRERIIAEHVRYQQGLLYFFLTDERVPPHLRAQLAKWGYAKDEFTDNGNWPWQIYVREARRMISDYVMTEHNVLGREFASDSIGMGAYPLDAHNFQRYVSDEGFALVEGGIFLSGSNPYAVSFRSIVPRRTECENLVVPWALSASHVAFLSIRMEPVLMVLAQSGATAACLALEDGRAVQAVDYTRLRERLLADGQVLEFKPNTPFPDPVAPAALAGIVVDDLDVTFTDDWVMRHNGRFVGASFRSDISHGKDDKVFRYQAQLPQQGKYEVRYAYAPIKGAATNAPVTVYAREGAKTIRLDLTRPPPIDRLWVSLGTFEFATKSATIVVSNAGTNGAVITDAVQFIPVPNP